MYRFPALCIVGALLQPVPLWSDFRIFMGAPEPTSESATPDVARCVSPLLQQFWRFSLRVHFVSSHVQLYGISFVICLELKVEYQVII